MGNGKGQEQQTDKYHDPASFTSLENPSLKLEMLHFHLLFFYNCLKLSPGCHLRLPWQEYLKALSSLLLPLK